MRFKLYDTVIFPLVIGIGLVLSIAPRSKAERVNAATSGQDIDQATKILEKIQEYNPLNQPTLKSQPLTNTNQESITFVKQTSDGILKQIGQYNQLYQSSERYAPLERVNSVNELSDVLPTDWAYSALEGLAERYGCLLASPCLLYTSDAADDP